MIEKEHCLIINAELDINCHNKMLLSQFGATRYYFQETLRLVQSLRLFYKDMSAYIIFLKDPDLYNQKTLNILNDISTLLKPKEGILKRYGINSENFLSGFDYISLTGFLIQEHYKNKDVLETLDGKDIIIEEKFIVQVDSDVVFLRKLPKLLPTTICTYYNEDGESYKKIEDGEQLRTNTSFIYTSIDSNIYEHWFRKLQQISSIKSESKNTKILEFNKDKVPELITDTDRVLICEEIGFDLALIKEDGFLEIDYNNIKYKQHPDSIPVYIWKRNQLGLDYMIPSALDEESIDEIFIYHDPFNPKAKFDLLHLPFLFKTTKNKAKLIKSLIPYVYQK